MSNSMLCWWLISQQFRRQIPTSTGLFLDLLVLQFYFMLPVSKCLCTNRSSVFFEGFLGRIFVGKFPTLVSLSSPFLAARVPRYWKQSVVQMCNFSYISWFRSYLLQKRKEIRCCSHFCRCNKTFFPLCRVILCFILQFAHNHRLHYASSCCSHIQISLCCKLNFYNKLLTTNLNHSSLTFFYKYHQASCFSKHDRTLSLNIQQRC